MNAKQESKFDMYLTVQDFLLANAAIVDPLPNFSTNFTSYRKRLENLLKLSEQQQFDKSGITATKNEIKKKLILLTADISRRLIVYAKSVNNAILLAEIKYPESELNHVSTQKLRDIAQGVYKRAQENIGVLDTYGINAATQTELQKAIGNFADAVPKTRIKLTDNVQLTSKIAAEIKEIDKDLGNIDSIIEIVRTSESNFYNGYRLVRKQVRKPGSSMLVRGVVKDSASDEAIKGATIIFTMNGNGSLNKTSKERISIFKKSASQGGFNITSMPEGTYYVSIKKAGYADQQTTVTISNGELKNLEIKLVKV